VSRPGIAIGVRGYGVVIWSDHDDWRVYAASDSMAATLATRTEFALSLSRSDEPEDICAALLEIPGSRLIAVGGMSAEPYR
jgi:anti-sigma-K factor RskA